MCPDVLGDGAGDAGLDVAVDVGVGSGELEPEGDVAVPACSNVLDRVAVVAAGAAAPQELLEAVTHDRVEQRLLAPEMVIQRRCANPRPRRDLPRRHGPTC